jgi:hypothetical protein
MERWREEEGQMVRQKYAWVAVAGDEVADDGDEAAVDKGSGESEKECTIYLWLSSCTPLD